MGSAVWGAAVRQFVPVVPREVLVWDDGFLSDHSEYLRGHARSDGYWAVDTSTDDRCTHQDWSANFSDACEAMAAHLRAAGFDVPPRPEGS